MSGEDFALTLGTEGSVPMSGIRNRQHAKKRLAFFN